MYITIEELLWHVACLEQQALFLRTFPEHEYPNGVEVTLDMCLRHSQDFDFVWAAKKFLRGEAWSDFFKAEEEAYQVKCLGVTKACEGTHPDGPAVRRAKCYYFMVTAQLFFEGVAAMEKGRE